MKGILKNNQDAWAVSYKKAQKDNINDFLRNLEGKQKEGMQKYNRGGCVLILSKLMVQYILTSAYEIHLII